MKKEIFIKLLGEGTLVYRPVPSIKISENLYILQGSEIYNPEVEEWEFKPGTLVFVEEKLLEGKFELIAIKEIN